MVIGGHVILLVKERVDHGIVGDVDQKIEIISADGFLDHPLPFSASKAWNLGVKNKGGAFVTGKRETAFVFILSFLPPFDKKSIHFLGKTLVSPEGDDSEGTDRNGLQVSAFFSSGHDLIRPHKFVSQPYVATCKFQDGIIGDQSGKKSIGIAGS